MALMQNMRLPLCKDFWVLKIQDGEEFTMVIVKNSGFSNTMPQSTLKNIHSLHKKKNLNSKYDHILRTNEYILKRVVTFYSEYKVV
jgi:hypothetical protein